MAEAKRKGMASDPHTDKRQQPQSRLEYEKGQEEKKPPLYCERMHAVLFTK